MSDVKLTVDSELEKISQQLARVEESAKKVADTFQGMGKDTEDTLKKSSQNTQSHFESLRRIGRGVAESIRNDFKTLFSLEAVKGALSLSNQFKNTIRDTVDLTDAIKKMGSTFGISEQNFSKFQSRLIDGLGKIGLSSKVAAKTMEGLLGLGVKGEGAVEAYSVAAGQLASISGERGNEGEIARGLAEVLRAQNKNVSDTEQVSAVAEIVRRVGNVSGQGAQETLGQMGQIFSSMAEDLRKTIGPQALGNLAIAGAVAGPSATKFLEEYLSKSKVGRLPLEAQGLKGVFGQQGIDFQKFSDFSKNIFGRTLGIGDKRLAAQTLGLSEEAAEGFVRLSERIKDVSKATEEATKMTGDLNQQYRSSLGVGEAFEASINRVKGVVDRVSSAVGLGAFSEIPQKIGSGLGKLSQTDAGAAATVLGGGALAAILAGKGLKGIGSGLGKGALIEGLSGRNVQPVYVVNADEISRGGGLGGTQGAGGALGASLAVGAAVATVGAGAAAMSALEDSAISDFSSGKMGSNEWQNQNAQKLYDLMDKMASFFGLGSSQQQVKVQVESVDPRIKATLNPPRGRAQ